MEKRWLKKTIHIQNIQRKKTKEQVIKTGRPEICFLYLQKFSSEISQRQNKIQVLFSSMYKK